MTAIATRAPIGNAFFANLISAVTTGWDRQVDYQRTVHELKRLSDRELEDIGIARYDIHAVARTVYRQTA